MQNNDKRTQRLHG